MTERPVNVLLDTSAIVAYTRGDAIGVGEVIAEIADEGTAFGIPLSCLVEAVREVRDGGLLDLLLKHPACSVVADRPTSWRRIAAVLSIVGRYDGASAVVLAYELDVQVLTRRPNRYEKLPDGGPVIEI